MALQARHRWIIQKIGEVLEIHDNHTIEEFLRAEENLSLVNGMFESDSIPTLFFYLEATEDGFEQLKISTNKCNSSNSSRSLYFFKHNRETIIDQSVAEDESISFGSIEGPPLESLEAALQHVFKPMLSKESPVWGKYEAPQEFVGTLGKFTDGVQEVLSNLQMGLELRKPDPKYCEIGAAIDSSLMEHHMELLTEWCDHTEVYLDEGDQSRFESVDAGPKTELEFWRRRMQRLTGLTEQLKTKECKTVIGVLTAVAKTINDPNERFAVMGLLKRWKQIDVSITEAANEAKDNVKYLQTLDKFMQPLYEGTPRTIIDNLPALMNSLKMIHTIARYYSTTERMTGLFMKITNQMVACCRNHITQDTVPELIWECDLDDLLERLEMALRLNEAYQEHYRAAKDKLLTIPKGKQFDFSETQIFGKFDKFCRRVIKLVDMFSTMRQFQELSRHNLEGMSGLIKTFFKMVHDFKMKRHDPLDFTNQRFDSDFIEFNVQVLELEASLQQFINQCFENISSIEQALTLLKKFQKILRRESLRSDLDSKFTVIFHNYGLELTAVQELYEKQKHAPPVPRNAPPVAGNIMWARLLLRRIEEPMKKFQHNDNVLGTKDSRKIIKAYNKVARTLVTFEYLWYEAWCRSIERAKTGLQATLIVRDPESGRLLVNFDPEVLQLIREARCLDRLGINVPEGAKLVMLQENKFKNYYGELSHALREYDRVVSLISPVLRPLLQPFLNDLERKLHPGMTTLTWTSMNIDTYRRHIHSGLSQLENIIQTVNDIVENRIEKNLRVISSTKLVHLPSETMGAMSLDEFINMQDRHVRKMAEVLVAKNAEVEIAVADVLGRVKALPLRPGAPGVTHSDCKEFFTHYHALMYQAILNATKSSLIAMKKRVCARMGTGFLFMERPFFEVDVQLSVPSVRLSPSLDDVQRAINKVAVTVLRCSKRVFEWKDKDTNNEPLPFFDRIGKDIQVVKVVLLLTGAFFGTKNQVAQYLSTFHKYDWLWKEDKEQAYQMFIDQNPRIEDFEIRLQKFVKIEREIASLPLLRNVAALSLNSKNIKLQLTGECRQWKVQYSQRIHEQARGLLQGLLEYIKVTTKKLEQEVDSLEALRRMMDVLREIRQRESAVEMEIVPILDMYQMLDNYLPADSMTQEERDQRTQVRSAWRRLVDFAEEVTDGLSNIQGKFKRQLMGDIRSFIDAQKGFRKEFLSVGPMVTGISSQEAIRRLKQFNERLGIMERKLETYQAGEDLFALRPTQYPELVQTKRELGLLGRLYTLHGSVNETVDQHSRMLWSAVAPKLDSLEEHIIKFSHQCKALPSSLQEWDAYSELMVQISDFQQLLPLLRELAKPCIKKRHWRAISETTGRDIPVESDALRLGHLLEAGLLDRKDDVLDIAAAAERQAAIEVRMRKISDSWSRRRFKFVQWQGRDIQIVSEVGPVVEDLEEAMTALQTQLSLRHVGPFKSEIASKLASLSDTADTLERLLKVQTLWCSLESVFLTGDIAVQMPAEARKFQKVDKEWVRLMQRAEKTGGVIPVCGSEMLRNSLPMLHSSLEKCQKSLEGYLEQKRSQFPRFYFISNPVLLQMLSQGSDLESLQPHYSRLFDAVSSVQLDKRDIRALVSEVGQSSESIFLAKPVQVTGSIEDWMCQLENTMQFSIKEMCEHVALECGAEDLRHLVDSNCAQMALLALQMRWTLTVGSALEGSKTQKTALQDALRAQSDVLSSISSWCLEDLNSLQRMKLETLVTVQLHMVDLLSKLSRLFKERKLTGSSDFEWLKCSRYYWRSPDKGSKDFLGEGQCIVSICDVDLQYGYEYLGCKERLVVTPLTDRCYVAMSQALGMHLGGAPAGPAGTGKTETIKDMGCNIGIRVVVTNCTAQQRFSDLGKIFKGLCQAGIWGCFDEFNRIELPVLSVVAQQILAISTAKKTIQSEFTFPGMSKTIPLNPLVAYFITMNPGYQGRQPLPENLKPLFRGVTMMVPDKEIIIRVKLCAAGYVDFQGLAAKFKTLYDLCGEQLSNQRHYDFGLRNILSILRSAGSVKRASPEADESELIYRSLRDMNLSKLCSEDVSLFLSLLIDLFPGISPPNADIDDNLKEALNNVIEREGWVCQPSWTSKVHQLHATMLVRHGIMLVGIPLSGKTAALTALQKGLQTTTNTLHKVVTFNPKAMTSTDLFGQVDSSGEWVDGVFAMLWSKFNDKRRKDIVWLTSDGPVDALWIENLNTVLDDNKLLTLANGDRLPMSSNVKLIFETDSLRNASPATVSRSGIIHFSESDLGWEALVNAWLKTRAQPAHVELLRPLFWKYLADPTADEEGVCSLVEFVTGSRGCKPLTPVGRLGLVSSVLQLLDASLVGANLSVSPTDLETELERFLIFSLTWSIGALLSRDDRVKFDKHIRLLSSLEEESRAIPPGNSAEETVFDFAVQPHMPDWILWSDMMEMPNLPPLVSQFNELLVPTPNSSRSGTLIRSLLNSGNMVLISGPVGCGKTSSASMYARNRPYDEPMSTILLSSMSTPASVQLSVELSLERRGGRSLGPRGKSICLFLDDLAFPEPNRWGDSPALEAVRQLFAQRQFYCLERDKRGDTKTIEDVQFIAAMNHPGAGHNDIPDRLKRHFFILQLLEPGDSVLEGVFTHLVKRHLTGALDRTSKLSRPVREVVEKLPTATVELWSWARRMFLPSPSACHHFFNLRDLVRVFEGVFRVPINVLNERSTLQLWRHECQRVFCDKLVEPTLSAKVTTELDEITMRTFPQALIGKVMRVGEVLFADVSKDSFDHSDGEEELEDDLEEEEEENDLNEEDVRVYEAVGSLNEAMPQVLNLIDESTPEANGLVFFPGAVRHLLRCSRILATPAGNALMLGVGGTGKRSLVRLSTLLLGYSLFEARMADSSGMNALMEDLKVLIKSLLQFRKPVVWLASDALVHRGNEYAAMLSLVLSGENILPKLFAKDELTLLCSEMQSSLPMFFRKLFDLPITSPLPSSLTGHTPKEDLLKYLHQFTRKHLHVALCLSPMHVRFREIMRLFPALMTKTSIDFMEAWAQPSLAAVAEKVLSDFKLACSDSQRSSLFQHIASTHVEVSKLSKEYRQTMHRHVYQTPKAFLDFLNCFKELYAEKLGANTKQESRVALGLQKLSQGAADVEKMKIALAQEEKKLTEAEARCNKMLGTLQTSSMEAKKESDAVQKIRDRCESDHRLIQNEKSEAESDLAKAKPYLDAAEKAIDSIRPGDVNEIKKLPKPSDIIRLTFDCVAVLLGEPLGRVRTVACTLGLREKRTFDFIQDSYPICKKGMLSDAGFLKRLFDFSKNLKDCINDETIELLQPYLNQEEFNPNVARNASRAAEGLCAWIHAMAAYQHHSKIVKPKLEAVQKAEARLESAQQQLNSAEQKLQKCRKFLDKLQKDFEAQLSEKAGIESNAQATRNKMRQATELIGGLSGERKRWSSDRSLFKEKRQRLLGDCASSAAFVSYGGSFNQGFRERLLSQLMSSLVERDLPLTSDLDVTSFLVDAGTIGDWALQGLPSDPLSVQNGVLVTNSKRYPLLIDPQGQGLAWLLRRESSRLSVPGAIAASNSRLADRIEHAAGEGLSVVVSDVSDAGLDPMFDLVLDRRYIKKGRSQYLSLGGRLCECLPNFRIFLATRLAVPKFSPEMQSMVVLIDFTVTQQGLEEQLLGCVIAHEQHSLEEQLKQVLSSVTTHTKALARLDAQLLQRLTANEGDLLEDTELMGVLQDTQIRVVEVKEKLSTAADTKKQIGVKREQYRPIASRGALLYFSIVDIAQVNPMYQTSLSVFLQLFQRSLSEGDSSSASTIGQRVINVAENLTSRVVRYVSRGLYNQDKWAFLFTAAAAILRTAGVVSSTEIDLFAKAGSQVGVSQSMSKEKPAPRKILKWMPDDAFNALSEISHQHNCPLSGIREDVIRSEHMWRRWYDDPQCERVPLVDCETRLLRLTPGAAAFYRLLVVRCMRPDRTLPALKEFVRDFTSLKQGELDLPALGAKYLSPLDSSVNSLPNEVSPTTPVLFLLTPGCDPSDSVDQLAKKMKVASFTAISLGEGQEGAARNALRQNLQTGGWVLLQNCHLCLAFMKELPSILASDEVHDDFRVWLTTAPHPDFPLPLLQMCCKVTSEAPSGLRAGVSRLLNTVLDQDRLERLDSPQWRSLVFALCFMHSALQERRRYGPLGWCIPYEFSSSDLSASLLYLERHLFAGEISWPSVQYMVCDIQYGGRITDAIDQRLLAAFASAWMSPASIQANFTFNPDHPVSRIPDDFIYQIPDTSDIEVFRQYARSFPETDSPEMFGLHPNADASCRKREAQQLFDVLLMARPSSAVSGTDADQETLSLIRGILSRLPDKFSDNADLSPKIAKLNMNHPLSVFLKQEIERFDKVLTRVASSLHELVLAARGEVSSTPALVEAMGDIRNGLTPKLWLWETVTCSDEFSWLYPSLSRWFNSLLDRHAQYNSWILKGRLKSHWLGGFFNPLGFFTTVKQECTRQRRRDRWTLEDVVLHTEITDWERPDQVRAAPSEGVYVHGLSVEGAGWSQGEHTLVESAAGQTQQKLPVLLVTGLTTAAKKGKSGDYGPYGAYIAPVYKYPNRTDKNCIFDMTFPSRDSRPAHWAMRGVAVLAATDV